MRRLLWLLILIAGSAADSAAAQSTVLKTDLGIYKEPTLPSLPQAGSRAIDPTFGTTIMRLTDGADGNTDCQVNYANRATFNTDSTWAQGRCSYSGSNIAKFYTFDPSTFTARSSYKLTNFSPDGKLDVSFMHWSGVDPKLIFGMSYSNKIWSYNVETKVYTLIKDLSGSVPSGYNLSQMMKDESDNTFSFTLSSGSSGVYGGYIVWRRSTNSILLSRVESDIDEVELDKSGRYLAVLYDSVNNNRVWDLQTQASTYIPESNSASFSHRGMGTGKMGNISPHGSYFSLRDLSSPTNITKILSGAFNFSQGSHTATMPNNESWVLISQYNETGGGVNKVFDNEITQIALDGSNRVRRIAHHRSVYNDYNDTPRANISRDGKFIAFTSNWGNASGRRDIYIVQVPPAVDGDSKSLAPSAPKNLRVQ